MTEETPTDNSGTFRIPTRPPSLPGSREDKVTAAMEHKAICVVVLALSLALSTLVQGQAETCEVTPTERKNCGFPGITARACHDKGCCFNSATRGVPWCFYPASRKAPEDDPDECEF
ncbi:trefoil factor 1 [Pteropus alecto]|uniref:trefoil factor 1 n=1 Tax=Pteropus alecto TaxID=9402 RepID=UPI0007685EEB|nr:trefoil factor 1 [Pteropus alecto]XP_015448572.1 trefoil factor 1 [Pteropus alecto]